MKKIFTIIAGILLLTGCNKNLELDIEYRLTANIEVGDVVKYIKDLDGSTVYEDGEKLYDDDRIILSYIIFDRDGNSIAEEQTQLSNFNGKTSIVKSLRQGEYTVTACVYMKDDETVWWTQEKPGSLKDYRIVYNDNWIGLSGVLGFYRQTLSLDKSETLSISVPSAVGFLILNYTNLNLSGIQTVRYGIRTWNRHLNVETGASSLLELLNDGNIYTTTKNSAYSNLTTAWYYLPTPQFSVVWEGRNANGTVVRSGTIPSSEVKAGTTRIVTINTNTGEASTELRSYGTGERMLLKDTKPGRTPLKSLSGSPTPANTPCM